MHVFSILLYCIWLIDCMLVSGQTAQLINQNTIWNAIENCTVTAKSIHFETYFPDFLDLEFILKCSDLNHSLAQKHDQLNFK